MFRLVMLGGLMLVILNSKQIDQLAVYFGGGGGAAVWWPCPHYREPGEP